MHMTEIDCPNIALPGPDAGHGELYAPRTEDICRLPKAAARSSSSDGAYRARLSAATAGAEAMRSGTAVHEDLHYEKRGRSGRGPHDSPPMPAFEAPPDSLTWGRKIDRGTPAERSRSWEMTRRRLPTSRPSALWLLRCRAAAPQPQAPPSVLACRMTGGALGCGPPPSKAAELPMAMLSRRCISSKVGRPLPSCAPPGPNMCCGSGMCLPEGTADGR